MKTLTSVGLILSVASSALCQNTNFAITSTSRNADGSVRLVWRSETNTLYDIYSSEDLRTQSWRLAAIQIPSQGTLTQWSDYGGPGRSHPSSSKVRFYRVGLTLDSDGDGLPDAYELLVSNTATNLADTNANDIPDGEEDFDGDGVVNVDEYSLMTSPYLFDSDGDGVSDGPNATNSIAAGPDGFFDLLVRGKVRGDSQVGEVSHLLQIPFVVYLTGTNGVPVPNGSNVTFTASYPSGADATSLLSNTSDATGNNGFAGQAQTSLTFGSETGTYKVVAHCGSTNFEFRAETITTLAVELTDRTYQSGSLGADEVVGNVAHVRVSVGGSSSNALHTIGVRLTSEANGSGIVAQLYETALGSGVFTGSREAEALKPPPRSMLASIPDPSKNPVGGNKADDEFAEHSSADNAEDTSTSDFSDSEAFDDSFDTGLWVRRGEARYPFPLPAGTFVLSKSFMKAAGRQRTFTTTGSVITTNWIVDQADVFYYSGHGDTDGSVHMPLGGKFGPGDVAGGEWKDDLEIMIFAGCSVLDVTGAFSSTHPGKLWAKTGPTFFLGYEGSAPRDNSGVPSTIIQGWEQEWELEFSYGDPISPWNDANSASLAWNAAAIDCSVSPKVAWHFTGVFTHTWTSVPEANW